MPTFWSELADLAVLLTMICVPLAVGAIAIPLGRALADRLRAQRPRDAQLDAIALSLETISARLSVLERAVDATADELERIGERQREVGRAARARPSLPSAADGRTPTPH